MAEVSDLDREPLPTGLEQFPPLPEIEIDPAKGSPELSMGQFTASASVAMHHRHHRSTPVSRGRWRPPLPTSSP